MVNANLKTTSKAFSDPDDMPLITLQDCLNAISVESSALYLVSKVAFNQKRGYTKSHDGQTFWDFGAHLEHNISGIARQLIHRSYTFKPCQKITRRIKQNKVRDIYISTWHDRVVERWLNDSLNRLLHGWFSRHSYAYRLDDLGLDNCQNQVVRAISPTSFIVKRDIASYFYTIDHELLLTKLSEIIDPQDYLYELLKQRIKFRYIDSGEHAAVLGIPFGTSIACTLANVYLTDIDKAITALPVRYFRYADDFLIVAQSAADAQNAAAKLDSMVSALKLTMKPAHTINASFIDHPEFTHITKFKYLGLEFLGNGIVRLAVEKQRKIMNLFKRGLDHVSGRLKRAIGMEERLKIVIEAINAVATDRIRSVAIIDYYVKHVNDEHQLRQMDRLVAELVISTALAKRFRTKDFRTISFKKLRNMGLISILHRHRLHKHGHIRIDFMSLHNELVTNRYVSMLDKRRARIDHMRMSRIMRRQQPITT